MKKDTPSEPSVSFETLATDIKRKLETDPEALRSVLKIGLTIESTGMSIDDCALLARISPERLSALSMSVPEIPIFFKLKRARYKEKLLKVLNDQATENKDVKIAMYLLEANFSEEYDPATKKEITKKKSKTSETDLEKLMERVRKASPSSPVADVPDQVDDDELSVTDSYDLAHLIKSN